MNWGRSLSHSLAEGLFILALISASPTPAGHAGGDQLVIWDVGQGQMVTWITWRSCLHFDMGGEKFPHAVATRCRGKENRLYVSHGDYDHIGLLRSFQKKVGPLCLALAPLLLDKPWQWRLLTSLPPCPPRAEPSVLALRPQMRPPFPKLSLNDWSWVFVVSSKILIAGDSTKRAERSWVSALPEPEKILYLVAGHHGSNTSTSEELLRELPHLRMAVVSARKGAYGHPHPKVLERLKHRGVKTVLTELQGAVFLPL